MRCSPCGIIPLDVHAVCVWETRLVLVLVVVVVVLLAQIKDEIAV